MVTISWLKTLAVPEILSRPSIPIGGRWGGVRRSVLFFTLCWLSLTDFLFPPTEALTSCCFPSPKQLPSGSLEPLHGNASWVSPPPRPPHFSNLQRGAFLPHRLLIWEPRTPSCGAGSAHPEDCPTQEVTLLLSFPIPGSPGPALLLVSQPGSALGSVPASAPDLLSVAMWS